MGQENFSSSTYTAAPTNSGPDPDVLGKNRYLLPWDEFEKKRLNMQQTVVLRSFNDRMFSPSIVIGDHDHVLDVGCGTGIWSLDLAARLPPTVQIEACDYSSANFLAQSNSNSAIPPNVQFSTASILALPPSWTGRFTIAHQRLLHPSITIPEWDDALKEVLRVLKPGGWLQIVEIDLSSFFSGQVSEVSGSVVPGQAELVACWKQVFRGSNMLWELQKGLGPLLEKAGFVNVEWDSKVFSLEGGVAPTAAKAQESHLAESATLADDTLRCMVDVIQSYKPRIVATGMISEDRFDECIEEMKVGWKNVEMTSTGRGWTWHMVAAQKPSMSSD